MRKYINIILVISFVMSLMVVGCSSKDDNKEDEASKEKLKVYYVSDEFDKLYNDEFDISDTDTTDATITKIIDKLKVGNFEKAKNPTIPSSIVSTSFYTNKNVLRIEFDKNYYEKKEGELLRRAAIVLTLCQLNDVDYVEFYVEKEPLIVDGKSIGAMSSETFVNDIGADADYKKRVSVSLYFAEAKGEQLVKVENSYEYDGKCSMEEFVLKKLIEGPSDTEKYCRTINADVGINRVSVNNSRCYVDFDENFLNKSNGVSEEEVIYSIVNTLTELPTVNEVMITINGDMKTYYQSKVRIDGFITRNYELNKTTE